MRKVFSLVAIVIAFLVLYVIVNVVHFRFFPVRVVLYDSVLDIGIALVAFAIPYALWRRRGSALSITETVLAMCVAALLALNYAILVPTVIDRSLSIYILEKLNQRGGAIRQDAFAGIFMHEYMPEMQLVDIRLTEQIESGTVKIVGGCVELTPRGRFIAGLTRLYRLELLPKHREIMGAFNDTLTDPFRNSRAKEDYACRARGEEPKR